MPRIEVHINKSKFKISITILSVLTITFGILSVLCIQGGWTVPFLMGWFLPTTFILATVLFGFAAIWMLKKSKDDTPALIIDDNGYMDNSGLIKGRLIPWSDIDRFEIKTMMGVKMIGIMLKDHESFIDSFSGIKKSMLKSTYKQQGTPLTLAPKGLDYDFDALFNELNSRLN